MNQEKNKNLKRCRERPVFKKRFINWAIVVGASCQKTSCQSTSCQSTSCQGMSSQGTSCEATSFQKTSCQSTSCQGTSCQGASWPSTMGFFSVDLNVWWLVFLPGGVLFRRTILAQKPNEGGWWKGTSQR